jgi:serine/threonine-protein kinase
VDIGSTPTLPPQAPPRASSSPRTPPLKRDSSSGGRTSPGLSSSSDSFDGARFVPGTVLEERYRIVALAGRGGMGEVYRAEDLKLGQTVALKFLPESLAQDGAALARFHREVRIARQVSHPNVCRVFDIGEADGLQFLSMEYVDGEDLATLLRRIGRLPSDKATEVARQICAGLAAAHDQGLIHRDLKPANVMIDGRGKVRITDFGLAGAAGSFRPEESSAGTPAYMAPEQLAGKDATVQSDIYALGLVLYEVFTGKRAFDAKTLADLRTAHEHSAPTHPSLLVKDMDPLVERVILRCLDKDPTKRPASALQVAAALPGGDPLAAALAAGETPSPEMVAAAGSSEGISPRFVWICIAVVALGLVFEFAISGHSRLYRTVNLPKPPEVLAERAREILRDAGYTTAPRASATGFDLDGDYLAYVERNDKSATRWFHVPGAVQFWYRQSPDYMLPQQILNEGSAQGRVTASDPPLSDPGMAVVLLDPEGHLIYLRVVPKRREPREVPAVKEPDWNKLLTAAGFDPAKCQRVDSIWTPPNYADARAAWKAPMPERPDLTLRIEAAALRGQPEYFYVTGPWTPGLNDAASTTNTQQHVQEIFALCILTALLVGGFVLARMNIKAGRGDRHGAFRLAAFVFCVCEATWLVGAHHTTAIVTEAVSLTLSLCWASLAALFMCMLYLALEPFVRRRMPEILISWSRLLSGQFKDPLVGRDLLAGTALALLAQVIGDLSFPVALWRGTATPNPDRSAFAILDGGRIIVARFLAQLNNALFNGLALMFVLVVVQMLVILIGRREKLSRWIAGGAFVIIWGARAVAQHGPVLDTYVLNTAVLVLIVFMMLRFGILATATFIFVSGILGAPLTTDSSAWYAWMGWLSVAVIAGIVVYGVRIGLAGKPLFGNAGIGD